MALKVKRTRAGGVKILKIVFREWLNKQPKKKLRHDPAYRRDKLIGWTADEFVLEARHRGLSWARTGTTHKWSSGTKPHDLYLAQLEKKFKTIVF